MEDKLNEYEKVITEEVSEKIGEAIELALLEWKKGRKPVLEELAGGLKEPLDKKRILRAAAKEFPEFSVIPSDLPDVAKEMCQANISAMIRKEMQEIYETI